MVRFENGKLGYIVICAIPLEIIIDENVDEDAYINFNLERLNEMP